MTLFDLAMRFVGDVHEITGQAADPAIVWFLRSCDDTASSDEIAWCSGFLNRLAWLCRLPRSKSLAARSWLKVGMPTDLAHAVVGYDVVVLWRGDAPQPGPDVINAPGHVGLFGGLDGDTVYVLGGNQHNEVNLTPFPKSRVLGVRRLQGA